MRKPNTTIEHWYLTPTKRVRVVLQVHREETYDDGTVLKERISTYIETTHIAVEQWGKEVKSEESHTSRIDAMRRVRKLLALDDPNPCHDRGHGKAHKDRAR